MKIINKIIFLIIITYSVYPISHLQKKNPQYITRIEVTHVIATMYNAVKSQCDNDPYITAGMYRINPYRASKLKWIALSRNLLKRWGGNFEYGDTVLIKNAGHKSGVYKVVDTMNKRFKNRIDFLETSGTHWYKFTNVKLIKFESESENEI